MTDGTARRSHELGVAAADIVVLTVLREEYEAVLACLGSPVRLLPSTTTPNTYGWQRGQIASRSHDAAFTVVVGVGTPTPTFGALATLQAIQLFTPPVHRVCRRCRRL